MSLTALYDLPAPAKLNLFLHVVGRRADGYHLLESVFQMIDWCDTLHLEVRRDGQLSRTDLGPALPADDLCLRAARALQAASGTSLGVHISIDKQVPWGAGLGGGSSDAATTLLGLNRLWALNWPRQKLLDIALTLGADVPFFVGGRNAWVSGIGEQLQPLDLPPAAFVVLKPDVSLPTAQIFSSPLLSRSTPLATLADFLAETNSFGKFFGKNDLEPCATAQSTEVGQALNFLAQHVGPARMTGSGSAVFSRFEEVADAKKSPDEMQQVLATLPQTWVIRKCLALPEHPLINF